MRRAKSEATLCPGSLLFLGSERGDVKRRDLGNNGISNLRNGTAISFLMKISFHSHANKTNFHMKSFAVSLAFIMRFTATRKWPIENEELSFPSFTSFEIVAVASFVCFSNLLLEACQENEFPFFLSSFDFHVGVTLWITWPTWSQTQTSYSSVPRTRANTNE